MNMSVKKSRDITLKGIFLAEATDVVAIYHGTRYNYKIKQIYIERQHQI